ncbi:MAG: MFS transporter [Ilumatobacteraceae bacterium]
MASLTVRPSQFARLRGFLSPVSLTARQKNVLVLLALASIPAAFTNTVFTQTVAYASDEFHISAQGQGFAAAIVRWGVIIVLPCAALADRIGRRRMILIMLWVAPLITSLGALSPNFTFLVITQAIGRPLGLALNIFIIVFATEEMSNDTRAFALSVIAVSAGFGAGTAVSAIPLAGISLTSWRYIYAIGLIWVFVAAIITRRLPETQRFESLHERSLDSSSNDDPAVHAHIVPQRLILQIAVAVLVNIFVAAASVFQIRYLKDVRGYSATFVALFTVATTGPASIGLLIGGRVADRLGRKTLAAITIPIGAVLIAVSFSVHGVGMWVAALGGAISFALAYPAMSVFRSELFPTAHRNIASAFITTASLIGGSIGLLACGTLINRGASYGAVMSVLAIGPVIVSVLVFVMYPETAHRELEELNPADELLQRQ